MVFRSARAQVRSRLVLRQLRRLDPRALVALEGRLADSEDALRAALALVHDAYVDAGIYAPHPSGMHVTPQVLAPSTWTFAAWLAGRMVGTVTLIGESPLGYRLDATHADVSAALRATTPSLTECGGLACTTDQRETGLVYVLFGLALAALARAGVATGMLRVPTQAAGVYEDAFGCWRVGEPRRDPRIPGKVYVVLAFDVASAGSEVAARMAQAAPELHQPAGFLASAARALRWPPPVDAPHRIAGLARIAEERPDLIAALTPPARSYLGHALRRHQPWPVGSQPALPALLFGDAGRRIGGGGIDGHGVGRVPEAREEAGELAGEGGVVDEQADVAAAREVVGFPVAGAEPAAHAVDDQRLGVRDPREWHEAT